MWNIYEYLVFILPLRHVSVLHDAPKSYLVVPGAIGRALCSLCIPLPTLGQQGNFLFCRSTVVQKNSHGTKPELTSIADARGSRLNSRSMTNISQIGKGVEVRWT